MGNSYPIPDNPGKRKDYKESRWHKILTDHQVSIWQNPLVKGISYTAGVCFTLFVARLLLYVLLVFFSWNCSWGCIEDSDGCISFVEFMSDFSLLGS